MTKEDRIALLRQFRTDVEEGNRATFRRMSKCEGFKIGNRQWDPGALERNRAKRKFSLTINRILPTILQITGTEVQNPRDIRVYHTRGGTKTMARLLTALCKHTTDTSHTNRQKSQMFDDGLTTARGWIGAEFDYAKDPLNADIVTKKYDPFSVLPDSNRTSYDLNSLTGGAKFVFVDEWIDKGKIEAENPKKKNDLANVNYLAASAKGFFSSIVNFMFDRSGPGGTQDDYRDHTRDEVEGLTSSRSKYNYRVSTCWWKEWKRGLYIQRLDSPLNYRALHKPADITAARGIAEDFPNEVRIIDKDRDGKPLTIGILNKTVMIGDVELSHKEDPFDGINLFPLIPFTPYYQNGYEFGIVQNLIGPQEQVNWSWSMELNLIKQLANVGWKVAKGVGKIVQFLKEHGSEDGIVLDESKGGGKIEKLEANAFPAGFDVITEKGSRHIAEISNVRLEGPQTDKDRVAAAIRLKQASAFTGSATLFSNYDYTMELLGQLIVELIRKMKPYSEDEIRAIVDEEDLIDAGMLDEARQTVRSQIEGMGETLPEPPNPPNQMVLQQASPEEQQAIISRYEEQMRPFREMFAQIDEVARGIAIQNLLAELENLQKGRYGTKVSLAPAAETMKVVKTLETFELNKMLIESQHQPLSRRTLIEAADPANKEAILAEEVG